MKLIIAVILVMVVGCVAKTEHSDFQAEVKQALEQRDFFLTVLANHMGIIDEKVAALEAAKGIKK